MSSKGEQIVARLFVKVALLISDARLTNREAVVPGTVGKVDKWVRHPISPPGLVADPVWTQFHLEVRDDGRFGSLAQEMKEMAGDAPLELRVRTVLVLPHLAPPSAQALVLLPEPSTEATRRVRVDVPHDARAILLEEWTLSLDRTAIHSQQVEDPYPAIYKQAIALVRSLYALLRYIPTWQLHRKLGSGAPMQMIVETTLGLDSLDEDVLGFGESLSTLLRLPLGLIAHTTVRTTVSPQRPWPKHLCIPTYRNPARCDYAAHAIQTTHTLPPRPAREPLELSICLRSSQSRHCPAPRPLKLDLSHLAVPTICPRSYRLGLARVHTHVACDAPTGVSYRVWISAQAGVEDGSESGCYYFTYADIWRGVASYPSQDGFAVVLGG
jgi:hypothetical protein